MTRWRRDGGPNTPATTALGNVGSGRRLGTHCYYLYRAGRNELPGVAGTYSQLTTRVYRVRSSMIGVFSGQDVTVAYGRLLELRTELHDVLRLTCLRMLEVGQALVEIAALYSATDEAAAEEFRRVLDDVERPGSDSDDAASWPIKPPVVPPPPGLVQQQPDDGHLAPPPEQQVRA
jgi:hypothetical protein